MKLPSLNLIISKSLSALQRFPMVMVSAGIAVSVSIYLTELNNEQLSSADSWFALLMVSVLGISFFFALKLIGEKQKWNQRAIWISNLLGATILAAYYFLLPEDLNSAPEAYFFRFILYFLASHLLVAIGPFWSFGEVSAFWQYNKTLFLRFLTALLFSSVLYVGLVIALGSIDVLLGVDIDDKRYFELFLLIGGLFNTWFFLSGIPGSIESFRKIDDYPKGLKIFTQNILIPLVTIYVVILYLYMGKIILEWSWPEGWVAYLVLSFSIAGIFALLLLHPIRNKAENSWIKKFSSGYFITLVPLVILLLLAIWRRIWEYSFTVNRYFVLVLGLWLAGIVVYFIFSKTKNIKVIPASLGTIAFLISFGPWSAFSVSEQSQKHRLEQYLAQNNILENGTIQKVTAPVPFEDRKEISNILRYLNEMHGLKSIEPWFEEDFSTLTKQNLNSDADSTQPVNRYAMPQHLTAIMGVEYVNQYQTSETSERGKSYLFSSTLPELLDIGNYNWYITFQYPHKGPAERKYTLDNKLLIVRPSVDQAMLIFSVSTGKNDTLTVNVRPLMDSLTNNYSTSFNQNIPPEEMILGASNSEIDVKFHVTNLRVVQQDSLTTFNSLGGRMLIKFKN